MNMLRKFAIATACVTAFPIATSAVQAQDASIPFVDFDNIQNWTAPDDHTVYLQDRRNQWFRADLAGSCPNLPFAFRIGVQTFGGDTFDNFSNIIVDRDQCAVIAVTKVNAPPSDKPLKKNKPAPAQSSPAPQNQP